MIKTNPLIQKLLSLNLPAEDYAVFGSGPMFAHGIKKELGHDLDIIARGKAWELACSLKSPVKSMYGTSNVVELFNNEIEIFDNWTSDIWDIDHLINTADVIDGIRFVKLGEVVKWKTLMGRDKDIEHIKQIKEYLTGNILR